MARKKWLLLIYLKSLRAGSPGKLLIFLKFIRINSLWGIRAVTQTRHPSILTSHPSVISMISKEGQPSNRLGARLMLSTLILASMHGELSSEIFLNCKKKEHQKPEPRATEDRLQPPAD